MTPHIPHLCLAASLLAASMIGCGDRATTETAVDVPGKLYKSKSGQIEGITLKEQSVSRNDLQAIVQGGSKLKSLSLIRCRIPAGSLELLTSLEHLDYLDLRGSSIADADLEPVGRLKTLTALDLYDTRITNAGVEHLKGLTNLKSLGLYKTDISGDVLKHVRKMKQLDLITVTETRIDDDGLRHLEILPQIRYLDVAQTSITGRGLEHVTGMSGLIDLNLTYCRNFNDAGLAHADQMHLTRIRAGFLVIGDKIGGRQGVLYPHADQRFTQQVTEIVRFPV